MFDNERVFSMDNESEEVNTSKSIVSDAVFSDVVGSPRDHKVRRAIANSNERRRMQSINAGFDSLKNLVCPQEKDKLSKASVLQQAVDCICNLQIDKQKLLVKTAQFKRRLQDLGLDPGTISSDDEVPGSAPLYQLSCKRRRKQDTESSDEGVGGMSALDNASFVTNEMLTDIKREMAELRCQLALERRIRTAVQQDYCCLVKAVQSDADGTSGKNCQVLQTAVYLNYDIASMLGQNVNASYCPVSVATADGSGLLMTRNINESPVVTSVANVIGSCRPPQPLTLPSPVQTSSRGSLQTIVEAIRHLEGVDQDYRATNCVDDAVIKQKNAVDNDDCTSTKGVCKYSRRMSSNTTELSRLLVAAEALQYIGQG